MEISKIILRGGLVGGGGVIEGTNQSFLFLTVIPLNSLFLSLYLLFILVLIVFLDVILYIL